MKLIPVVLVFTWAGAAWANPCTATKAAACPKACDGGDAKACMALASALKTGLGGLPLDRPGSQAASLKACNLGAGEACNTAGATLIAGGDVAKDEAGGVALIEKACTLKYLFACNNLASFYDEGNYGLKADPAKAAEVRNTACNAGGKEACVALGESYDQGKGVATDKAKAHALYVKACGLKSGAGCFAVGIDQRDGEGTAADPKAMAKSLEQACTLDFSPACSELALALSEGRAGKKDAKKAFTLAKKACERVTFPTSFEACAIASQWARDGEGTRTDLKEAKRLADHGCLNKEPKSCELVNVLELLLQTQ